MIEKARQESAMIFVRVLFSLYSGNALMAVFITPHTHIGGSEYMPLHLWLAIAGSAFLVIGPILLLLSYPLSALARHAAAIAVGLECSLATALSGGQIELHFTFFIAMVFLALALDAAILWTFVATVLIDHAIRGFIFPDSVYGCSMWQSGRPPLWLAFEHAGFVALQLLALIWFIKKRIGELAHLHAAQTDLAHVEGVKTDQIVAKLNHDLVTAYEQLRATSSASTVAADKVAGEAKIAKDKVAAAITKAAREI